MGRADPVPSDTAAAANAMCAEADETDDAHRGSTTHPGAAVVSAALAMAQEHRASGQDFLNSAGRMVQHVMELGRLKDLRGLAKGLASVD